VEKKKLIEIIDYDPSWPITFGALRDVLLRNVQGLIVKIEHVGSTSVHGLAAKPIIDIDVVMPGKSVLPQIIQQLKKLGYEYESNLGIDDRHAFARTSIYTPNDGRNTVWPRHHLYCCTEGSFSLTNHLLFRNYLRRHPEKSAQYGNLKKQLALQYPFMPDEYVKNKTHFIVNTLRESGVSDDLLLAITKQNESKKETK
jgi:GrpB-like predicted nucleotidyltransferase (UPF0157 family)